MLNRRYFTQSLAAAALLGSSNLRAQNRTLTYVGWSHDEAASKGVLTSMFDGYRKNNPDTKLDVIGFPWGQMQQNILLRMRSGQPLDVVQLAERWLPQFGSTGRLLDLNDVYGKGTLQKAISPGLLKLGEYRQAAGRSMDSRIHWHGRQCKSPQGRRHQPATTNS